MGVAVIDAAADTLVTNIAYPATDRWRCASIRTERASLGRNGFLRVIDTATDALGASVATTKSTTASTSMPPAPSCTCRRTRAAASI